MKNMSKLLVCFVVTALVLAACQPEAHKEVGEARDVLSSLAGTWKLTKALQVDEDASRKGFPYKELDLTPLFPYTDFRLTLNVNGKTPSTFATVAGNSPKIVKLTAGNWSVDDPSYPKVITLTSGSSTEKMTLGSYPVGATKSLKVRVERRDASAGDKLLISYTYEFAKQ